MITKAAQIVNEATRGRWSTIYLLTLIFTSMRAVVDWDILRSDVQLFFVKLFATLIISFVISFIIHVMLYVVFSHKAKDIGAVFEKPTDEPLDEPLASATARMPSKSLRPAKKAAKKRL